MWVLLKLPETGSEPLGKPHCPYCRSVKTKVYERIIKKVKHPHLSFVSVVRRRCERCGRTFRHYAPGVSRSIQTVTVRALNVLLYSMGFSYSQIVDLLGDFGVKLVKSTVWRSVRPVGKKACYLHTQSLKGRVKVMGVPANLFRTKGGEVSLHLVGNLLKGDRLELEFPDTEEDSLLINTITGIAKKIGIEFTTKGEGSVTNSSTESSDFERDAYISRLRRSVKRRYRDLTQEADHLTKKANRKKKEKLQELLNDCKTILDIIEGRQNSCEEEFWEIYKRYAWAKAPNKGETATLWYKMRLFTLRLWDESSRILQRLESSTNVEKLHH